VFAAAVFLFVFKRSVNLHYILVHLRVQSAMHLKVISIRKSSTYWPCKVSSFHWN